LLTKKGHNFEDGKELVSRHGHSNIEFAVKFSTRKKAKETTHEQASRISKLADGIDPATNSLLGKPHYFKQQFFLNSAYYSFCNVVSLGEPPNDAAITTVIKEENEQETKLANKKTKFRRDEDRVKAKIAIDTMKLEAKLKMDELKLLSKLRIQEEKTKSFSRKRKSPIDPKYSTVLKTENEHSREEKPIEFGDAPKGTYEEKTKVANTKTDSELIETAIENDNESDIAVIKLREVVEKILSNHSTTANTSNKGKAVHEEKSEGVKRKADNRDSTGVAVNTADSFSITLTTTTDCSNHSTTANTSNKGKAVHEEKSEGVKRKADNRDSTVVAVNTADSFSINLTATTDCSLEDAVKEQNDDAGRIKSGSIVATGTTTRRSRGNNEQMCSCACQQLTREFEVCRGKSGFGVCKFANIIAKSCLSKWACCLSCEKI